MKEIRKKVKPLAELLEYKIRSGEFTYENGDKIWRLVLKNPDIVDAVMDIMDRELSEEDTLMRVERLV